MSTKLTGAQRAAIAVVVAAGLAVVIVVGLLLREHGPGNMGNGFLMGALVGVAAAAVAIWRSARRPDRTTLFERAWSQQGDERDDAVLTHALAVVGLLALPLTGAAAVAIGLGALVEMVLALLLGAEVLVFAVSFWVLNRRM